MALTFVFRFAKHEPSRLGGIHVRFRFAKFEAGRLVPPIISRAIFCLYRVPGWSRQWSSHGVIRLAHSIVSGGSSGRAPKWSISALNDGRDPLFSTIFSRTCDHSSIDLVEKCSVIFLMTNKRRRRRTGFGPDRSLAIPGFRPRKRLYARK